MIKYQFPAPDPKLGPDISSDMGSFPGSECCYNDCEVLCPFSSTE